MISVFKGRPCGVPIAFALKQQEVGAPVEEIRRKMGIWDATFYNLRKKYSGLSPSGLRRRVQAVQVVSRLFVRSPKVFTHRRKYRDRRAEIRNDSGQ